MASEPALSYLLTRTALGLGLAVGVVAVAHWSAPDRSNTSSVSRPGTTPSWGPRG